MSRRRWRRRYHEKLVTDARLVTVLAPPTVAPSGAITVWSNLVGLLRPGWRRPAMLLALAYHLTGNGVGSLMAAEIAGLWSPPGDVSHLLLQAIQNGFTPADLRCAVAEAAADAP